MHYNGSTFVAGPSFVDVVLLTIVDCLWTVNVIPMVKSDEESVEGLGRGTACK